jgi:hypothetical protein
VRLTRYSAASSVAEGICSPGSHSPAPKRSRSAAATVRYGISGCLELLTIADSLRQQAAEFPPDGYDHHPMTR